MKKGIKTRGNGQGCAIKVSNNNWKAIAVIGYKDEDYRRPIKRTKSGFRTKSEALAYIPTLKMQKRRKQENLTLKTAFDRWFSTYTAVSRSTRDCYHAAFNLFLDCFYIPISDLDIDELQSCIDCSEKGDRTKQNAKIVLNLIYKWAIPRGYVRDNINLAQYIKVRTETAGLKKPSFTALQLEKIKNSIGKVPYADYIYCHCYLGFRPTALLQLKVSDYDPVEKTFTGGIKTEAGKNRIVTISPKIQPIIDSLIEDAGQGYVFGDDGEYLDLIQYRWIFYKAMESLGFQNENTHVYTPHSCRHTFATLMKSIVAPDKDKLELIGHTTTEQLNYYQSVNLDDLRKITDNI